VTLVFRVARHGQTLACITDVVVIGIELVRVRNRTAVVHRVNNAVVVLVYRRANDASYRSRRDHTYKSADPLEP